MLRSIPSLLVGWCVLAVCLVVGGCKNDDGRTQIVVIPKGNTHEHWKGVQAGAERAGKERNVNIIWKGPLKESDRQDQIGIVEQFAGGRVKGIVLAPLDDKALLKPVQQAVTGGTKVIIIDSPLAGEVGKDFLSLVATDNFQGGYLGGKELAARLGGKGKVVLLRYMVNSASTDQREAGFLKAMAENPNIEVVSKDQYAGATASEAQQRAEAMMPTLRTADGVFTPNESSTQGMLTALEGAGLLGKDQTIKFVGFDKSAPLVAALEAGKIHGLVAQNPDKMGYEAVMKMVDALEGKQIPPSVDTGVVVITRETINNADVKALLGR
jgi:ribose transport system substrate-binding protein